MARSPESTQGPKKRANYTKRKKSEGSTLNTINAPKGFKRRSNCSFVLQWLTQVGPTMVRKRLGIHDVKPLIY